MGLVGGRTHKWYNGPGRENGSIAKGVMRNINYIKVKCREIENAVLEPL